jgi:hypothetical protein
MSVETILAALGTALEVVYESLQSETNKDFDPEGTLPGRPEECMREAGQWWYKRKFDKKIKKTLEANPELPFGLTTQNIIDQLSTETQSLYERTCELLAQSEVGEPGTGLAVLKDRIGREHQSAILVMTTLLGFVLKAVTGVVSIFCCPIGSVISAVADWAGKKIAEIPTKMALIIASQARASKSLEINVQNMKSCLAAIEEAKAKQEGHGNKNDAAVLEQNAAALRRRLESLGKLKKPVPVVPPPGWISELHFHNSSEHLELNPYPWDGPYYSMSWSMTQSMGEGIKEICARRHRGDWPDDDLNESHHGIPGGFEKVSRDINLGCGGKYIYLYSSRRGNRSPISDIQIKIRPSSTAPELPYGWYYVTWYRTNDPADLKTGAGGLYLFLIYKKEKQSILNDLGLTVHSKRAQITVFQNSADSGF